MVWESGIVLFGFFVGVFAVMGCCFFFVIVDKFSITKSVKLDFMWYVVLCEG